MADITIYKPAGVTVNIIDGEPPVDQSALVSSLQAQVSNLNAQVQTLQDEVTLVKADAAKLVSDLK